MSTESVEFQSEPETDTILEIRNATVEFDSDRGVSRVLDDVDLTIQREEILGIVGESGSGKSMLADSILDAVVRPGKLTGDVTYYPREGEPVDVLNLNETELNAFRWEEIAMVFQGAMSSFNPTKTIRFHFEETLAAHDADHDEGMAHAKQLLSDLYLDPERVLDSYPHELSGGMKQRALIALSLVLKPEVLVMDEPTAALDLLMQRSILSLLRNLKDTYDLTLIFITHDLPLVAELADRLGVLYAFQLVEQGPTEEILEDAAHPYTRSLLKAVPNLDAPLASMRPIEGSAPDPVNTPRGCSFAPRCPIATDKCTVDDPGFEAVTDTHETACFHWEDAAEAVPFETVDVSTNDDSQVPNVDGARNNDPVVSLQNVDVHFEKEGGFFDMFDDPDIVRAVDDLSLDIHANDVVALVGESGCGKTTLGKTAIGVQRPTDGTISYRGQDIWKARDYEGDIDIPFTDIRRALQIIHQDPGSALNPNQRIMNTLEMPLKRWDPGRPETDRSAEIHAMLAKVGMSPPEDYAHRFPHQLSGGEKQRVALIRALLMNPDLILADEAISALDVSLRVEMMDLMLELQQTFDTSYLFISHDLSNARYFAANAGGRIGVMYLGELVEIGPAEEIIQNPKHPYTKVLRWATADLDTQKDRSEEPPVRTIDIPDPVNPPNGCRFHNRCPEAREACTAENPQLIETEDNHGVACFREVDDHEYWESEQLVDADE